MKRLRGCSQLLVFLYTLAGSSLAIELLQNGGLESLSHWNCYNSDCFLTADRRSGLKALQISHRQHLSDGPSQFIQVTPGQAYHVTGYVKLKTEQPGYPTQTTLQLEIMYKYADGTHHYQSAATRNNVSMADGWVLLDGFFSVPKANITSSMIYFQGPHQSVDFAVDDVSLESVIIRNGDLESLEHWDCWNSHCDVMDDSHSGLHAVKISQRQHPSDGPSQFIQVTPGHSYEVEGYIKLLSKQAGRNTEVAEIELEHIYTDGTRHYQTATSSPRLSVSSGWQRLFGNVDIPKQDIVSSRLYFQGPAHTVDFAVDSVTVRENLVHNGGLESGMESWACYNCRCSLEQLIGVRSGKYAVTVADRQHASDGPSQFLQLVPGVSYRVTGYVRLLDDVSDDADGQWVAIKIDYKYSDNSHFYQTGAEVHGLTTSQNWVRLSAVFAVPQKEFVSARLYYEGPATSVRFTTDDTSVVEIPKSLSWQTTTDDIINKIRKSDITIRVTTGASIDKNKLYIQVLQTRKSFPFGTAVNSVRYNNNDGGGRYRDFIHRHFNWAVPESMLKWKSLEPHRGHADFQPVLNMIHGVKAHGLKVRGHHMITSSSDSLPDWLIQLPPVEMRAAVADHVREVMNHTYGLLEHWDMSNENLHHRWLEEKLHDKNLTQHLFTQAHALQPNVTLFLNDFNVVVWPINTQDYYHQGQSFVDAKVPLGAMGAQCHFGRDQEPDPNVIKDRLDTLSQVGVPVWITELDCPSWDPTKRADHYERALRAFYGHPAVHGILLWGFWDHAHWLGAEAALATGDDLQLTPAGRRVLDLLENQWMTDETRLVATQGNQFKVRGFHGDYKLKVIYDGTEVNSKIFSLGKEDMTVSVDV